MRYENMKTTKKAVPMKKYEPMPMMRIRPLAKPMKGMEPAKPMGTPKPVKENPTRMSPAAMRRADTTTMETYKKQKPTSTTTTTPAPRLKKAEAEPSFFERAKSGLKSFMPKTGKLAYNEENFEPEKKMVGKAQRGMKSYLKGSMGKGGM